MGIELRYDLAAVDWNQACTIFERAPLGTREPDQLRKTYEGSSLCCFAFDGQTMVAIARALSDGVSHSVIYDLCMFPEYQGRGLGRRMMQEMMARLNTENTILWSVPGKEPFYAKLGFAPMRTAMAKFKDPEKSRSGGYIE